MKSKSFLFLFLFLIVPTAVNLHAADLLEQVKEDTFLMDGNVSIVEHGDGAYLVSVGISTLKQPVASLIRKARLEAKLRAQQQLSLFINDIDVRTTEILEETSVVEQTGSAAPVRSIASQYSETIQEMNQGPLTGIITIGSGSAGRTYYYILGIKLP